MDSALNPAKDGEDDFQSNRGFEAHCVATIINKRAEQLAAHQDEDMEGS